MINPYAQNPHIGRNLYLHPVNFVGGIYKEDVKPWEGKSTGQYITRCANVV
jgi:hypothetical protein